MKSKFLVLFIAIFIAVPFSRGADAWEPKKPVDLVIVAGQGGSTDHAARLIQGIVEQRGMSSKPFIPVNRAGGAGAEGLSYASKAGDPDHTLLIVSDILILTPMQQPGLEIDFDQFAPIALLGSTPLFLWAERDSRLSSAREVIEMIARRRVRIEGRGSAGRLLANALAAEAGEPQTGSETITIAGKSYGFDGRALRSTGFWANLYVAGAPGMSDDARRYYMDLFQTVFEQEGFLQFREKRMLVGGFLSGDPLKDMWKRQADLYERIQLDGLVYSEEDDPECDPECPPSGSCDEAILMETAEECCTETAMASCPE